LNSRLKPGQRCPLHSRTDCCGRAPEKPREGKYPKRFGVTYFPDGREKCTPAKLRERKEALIRGGHHTECRACGKTFDDYRDIELAHIVPKGMNGGKHDDSWSNITLLCVACNRECGSRTLADYLVWRREKGLPTP
jgi:hypothetical protein